jgi:hypothetical protein
MKTSMTGPREVPGLEIREHSAYRARPSGKAVNGCRNRDAQLGEFVHSIAVEQLPEHELVCGSEPARERGEVEAVAE